MNQSPNHNKATAYLRQLCCSGLSKEIVIPEFLRAVKTVLPSDNNTYTGFDEQFRLSYHILGFSAPDFDEIIPEVIFNYFTPELSLRAALWFRHNPVFTERKSFDEYFYKSDMYNLISRPLEQHHGLHALVLQSCKPVGMVNLFRPPQQKPFNCYEQSLITRLLPYVAHALQASHANGVQYSENSLLGLMIMDIEGTIQYLSHEANKLLALASHPVLTPVAHSQKTELLIKIAQLCRNLESIYRGQDAPPPSWSFTNPTGRFTFRAQWLNKQNNEISRLIGMSIEHQEPIVLKILRGLQNLPLSPVQKQVALLLAQGFPSETIGQQLHIKLTTVKDYIRIIFVKMDISHRGELLPKLLALDSCIPRT